MQMSPIVLRTQNIKVVVYPKDHLPPHVHVLGPDAEAKFSIEKLECFYSRGFSERELARIRLF